MGEIIKVNPEELKSTASKIETNASNYQKVSSKLMEIATEMGEAWKGADNQAYVSQIKGFTEDLNDMVKKLKRVSEALEQQSTNYIKRQESNIEDIGKLTN